MDDKLLAFPTSDNKKTTCYPWWPGMMTIMASNKWHQLFDATTNTIIMALVLPTLHCLKNKLYNEVMHAFDTKTQASLNTCSDLFNDGIKLLWALYNKFISKYNALTLQQAITKFQSLRCNGKNFTRIATKIGMMQAELAHNGKIFSPDE
eukprot:2751695-Ditylum_brightwellii.AAC.1